MKTAKFGVIAMVVTLLFLPAGTALAKSVGLEHDGVPGCTSASDMGIAAVAAGDTLSFDLYFYDMAPVFSANCTFCVQDKSMVDTNSVSYTYATPGGWTNTPMLKTTDIDPALTAAYPNLYCWLVQATDFSFANPFPGGKHGTFQFAAAADGCLGFVMDGAKSGVFFTSFSSGVFSAPGETCPPFECVSTVEGVDVVAPADPSPVVPGTAIDYVFKVKNTGNVAEDFDLVSTSSNGWSATVTSANPVAVADSDSVDVTVKLIVPADLPCPVMLPITVTDILELKASKVGDPAVSDSDSVTTTVAFPSGVTVIAQLNGVCGTPGTTKQVFFDVTNTGACDDIFTLEATVDKPGWTATLPLGVNMSGVSGDTVQVPVDLTISAGALCTDMANLQLKAIGQLFGAADSATVDECVQEVFGYSVDSPGDQVGDPGDSLEYCWTITNTGNCRGTFTAVAFASAWSEDPTQAQIFSLDPGDSVEYCWKHIIPADAQPGDIDGLCLSITPPGNKSRNPPPEPDDCVTSTVRQADCTPDFSVAAAAGNPASGLPGAVVTVTFDLVNNGASDQFSLSAETDLGWTASIQGSNPVGPFTGTQQILVDVTIPAEALCTQQAIVYLTAKSVSCDTLVAHTGDAPLGVDEVCLWSIAAQTAEFIGAPGDTASYIFRITNEGNCEATPFVSFSSAHGWVIVSGQVGPFGPSQHQDVGVKHVIPADAQQGDEDQVRVCASCGPFPKEAARPLEPVCDSLTTRVSTACDIAAPVLKLGGVQTVAFDGTFWDVQVELKNTGPGEARSITATMDNNISWLTIPDPSAFYGDLPDGAMSWGDASNPTYRFDLTNYPGGSFNVWFDVAYTDTCPTPLQIRLDPEFLDPSELQAPGAPALFRLGQNVPNPFNPRTKIAFRLPSDGETSLVIHNAAGQMVRTLWSGHLNAGDHEFEWFGRNDRGADVPSGIYFYSLKSAGREETKRMVLIR